MDGSVRFVDHVTENIIVFIHGVKRIIYIIHEYNRYTAGNYFIVLHTSSL